MEYKDKYIKYKTKYINLKNQIGGRCYYYNDYKHIICLLWFNFDPKIIDPVDKSRIFKSYKMYKEKYCNKKVVLFLNYENIMEEDFETFRNNQIETENLYEFNVIKNNVGIINLLHDDKINGFIRVDILKILIQYEKMFYSGYEYVIFSDIDILDKNDNNEIILTCTRSDKLDKYYPSKILNSKTLKILDIFGYVMTATSKEINLSDDTNKIIFEFVKEKNPSLDPPPGYIKNNDTYYLITNGLPENSFLMSKKTCNVKKAIEDYFINSVFLGNEYNLQHTNHGRDYIFFLYKDFFKYLNFLNGLNYLQYYSSNEIIQKIKENVSLEENKDYKINPDDTHIIIMTINCFNYIKNFESKFYDFIGRLNINDYQLLTAKGMDVFKKFSSEISPSYSTTTFHNPLMSVKCVNVERTKGRDVKRKVNK
jgi:hypothetical protein